MFENLVYITVITTHPGRYPNNGGEYGYSYRLYPSDEPGVWGKEYHTTAEMKNEYCPVIGAWQNCHNCPECSRDDNECRECGEQYETVTNDEIRSLADRFPSGVDIDMDGSHYGIIDTTGHECAPGRRVGVLSVTSIKRGGVNR